jgi:hypothetical protein
MQGNLIPNTIQGNPQCRICPVAINRIQPAIVVCDWRVLPCNLVGNLTQVSKFKERKSVNAQAYIIS